MKTIIDQPTLIRELSLLQGIIEKKSTLEALANVVLSAHDGGRVTLIGTDLEVGYKATIPATVEQPGTVAVDARRLHDIVRRMPPGNISFVLDGEALRITMEKIRFRLATHDTEDFPTLPRREGDPTGALDGPVMADMVRRVLFAITTDDPRYSLAGALWNLEEDALELVATDGHRLSLTRRPATRLGDLADGILVPRKALAEIGKLADDQQNEVRFWVENGTLFVTVGDRELSARLQEPKFPDYRKVLEVDNDKVFEIGTADLKAAIERVAVLSTEQSHMIRLDLAPERLVVSSRHHVHGDAVEELAVEYDGEPLEIGFNAQYLLDFLGVAGTEKIRAHLGEPMSQGLFEPVREEGDDRVDRYVVMPMALG
ncbi:MAG: DNA polymerase III subunit beta [Acidobacteriota bacterium]